MKNLIKMLRVSVVAAMVAMPLTGQAAVFNENMQVRGAWADAGAYVSDGCIYASAYTGGGDQVTHSAGGPPTESGYAYAYVYGNNWCTGESFNGWGSVNMAPTISGLTSATISMPMTVNVCMWWWSCTSESATLTANLTGTGDISNGHSMNHWSSGTYRYSSRSNGKYRSADATMSLILDSNGTDLLVGSTGWGSLSKVNSGSHTIIH